MKVLIYGSGPIGRWLALRLHNAGKDVTMLARNETYQNLKQEGISLVDGFSNLRETAQVKLVQSLVPDDKYDLIVVAMRKSSRMEACPVLSQNKHIEHVIFMGNDISGFQDYCDHLPTEKILLGFPNAGGGWEGEDLIFVDAEKPGRKRDGLYIGELDGSIRNRTRKIKRLFESAGLPVSLETDIEGWLKYHFAFIGPTSGLILKNNGDLQAAATDKAGIRRYVMACREAGNVLRKVGFKKRQPPIFNIYYWLPLWLAPRVFGRLLTSRRAEVAFGLHAKAVGSELRELKSEFLTDHKKAGIKTPALDELLSYI